MFSLLKKDEGNILEVGRSDQYHTVDELVKRSQPNSVYYTLLILSSILIVAGLLLENDAVVIGGVLIAPVMTPILLFSLGLSTFKIAAIRRGFLLMAISFLITALIAWVLSQIFVPSSEIISFFAFDQTTSYLYLLAAFVSGMAATLGWTRRELSDVLPGVAIAVALSPPLALMGILFSIGDLVSAGFYFYLFIFNLAGLILGSLLVYLLLKFYHARSRVEKSVESS